MRRNKDSLALNQVRKAREGVFMSKANLNVLKNYNSCLHQKIINKKDMPLGPTLYISSVGKNELTKTLQAYYSRRAFPLTEDTSQLIKNYEKSIDIIDINPNKVEKFKCEGFCGRYYNISCINVFSYENKSKNMCPKCIEQALFGIS